jgi:hypothetical protein
VESEAPSEPSLVSPETGSKPKSPVLFDWEDVTDESLPVTYTLQITDDKAFEEDKITLEKTELEESEYTLTEAEEKELKGQETDYYWRVKAIDAASNESEWSDAWQLSISETSGLPTWALYTLLGIGAVVLFALGYWLGRRSNFYY